MGSFTPPFVFTAGVSSINVVTSVAMIASQNSASNF
jgi:hypothetical protein